MNVFQGVRKLKSSQKHVKAVGFVSCIFAFLDSYFYFREKKKSNLQQSQ